MMKLLFAIWFGKLIDQITRSFKIGGGSAAPGYYALKIEPKLVEKLASQIPQSVIITGTNGKTTTSRMLGKIVSDQQIKIIRNTTGSNLERGLASTLINHCSWLGRIEQVALAVWEIDEAAFNTLALKLAPNLIIFLNIFRDQLDRYGEIDTTVLKWAQTLKRLNKMPHKTRVLINGDDPKLHQLKDDFDGNFESFGISGDQIRGEAAAKLKKIKVDYLASKIDSKNLEGTSFCLLNQDFFIPVPGLYHIYDAVAAIVGAYVLNLSINAASKTLKNYSPAFGRMEKIQLKNNHQAYIFLIKNPTGATEVIRTIVPNLKPYDRLLIALNDNFADGKDVSWIWDTNFESLQLIALRIPLICSGTRAEDLAVRLKYAGARVKDLTIEPNLEQALRLAQTELKGTLYIFPTYTALLKLQKILVKEGIKPHYWTEN